MQDENDFEQTSSGFYGSGRRFFQQIPLVTGRRIDKFRGCVSGLKLVHSNSIAAHNSHTDLPCLVETKLAEGLIQSSQEFYLRGLLARSEVQPQTHGQTTAEVIQESKAIGSRLR